MNKLQLWLITGETYNWYVPLYKRIAFFIAWHTNTRLWYAILATEEGVFHG